jgi:glutathione S-transferase
MTSPIVLYDIPSSLPGNAWSPSIWKTRFALNIKGLPHETEWVEYPDIEALAKKIGAPPTRTKPDGSPMYTLPIINDPNTGKVISDSFLIAEYLDATYPGGNTLFPPGTKPLIASLEAGVRSAFGSIFLLQLGLSYYILNPASEKYFRATREAAFGMKIEEFCSESKRAADLAKAEGDFAAMDGWLAKSDGKYVMGDTVSYADGILAGWMIWIRNTNGIWTDVATWHNGRWETYLATMDSYAAIN